MVQEEDGIFKETFQRVQKESKREKKRGATGNREYGRKQNKTCTKKKPTVDHTQKIKRTEATQKHAKTVRRDENPRTKHNADTNEGRNTTGNKKTAPKATTCLTSLFFN